MSVVSEAADLSPAASGERRRSMWMEDFDIGKVLGMTTCLLSMLFILGIILH